MRYCITVPMIAVVLCAGGLALSAAVTPEQKKELSSIRADVNKIPALLRKKQFDEAEKSLTESTAQFHEFLKSEKIPETDAVVKSLRLLIEKQKTAVLKASGKPLADEVSFTEAVAPVMAEKCLGCHGDDAKGGLRLDTFAGMEQGGANGPLLQIGKPEQSLLMARLLTQNPQLRMPKGGEALAVEDIKKIRDWIAGGAKFDAVDKNAHLKRLEKAKPPVQVAKPTGDEKISFVKDVAPGFVNVCQRCHNANNRQGGLSMVTFEKLMQGGDSGKVIIPEKLADSKLWKMLEEGDMPRGQARITRKWYDDLKTWILEGCKYDHSDPRAELAKLIPSEEDLKRAELEKLSPEEFSQKRLAISEELWLKTFPKGEPRHVDSREFYVFGDVSENRLQQVSGWAGEQVASLRTMFQVKDEPLFRGKLTIFVFKDRFGYEEFNSTVHRREVPREVVGHSQVTPISQEDAFLALEDVGDEANETSPGMALNLMEQLAGAFLRREAKEDLPDWLIRGTGLALGAKAELGHDYLQAQRRAVGPILVNARLERPEQIFESGTFSPSEVGPVGLTVVEFLLKQGGGAKFGQFVKRVQWGEKPEDALKGAFGTDARVLGQAYALSHAGTARKSKK